MVPAAIRKAYNLTPASKLEWMEDGECIRVVPVGPSPIAEARGLFKNSGLGEALLKSRREDRNCE